MDKNMQFCLSGATGHYI